MQRIGWPWYTRSLTRWGGTAVFFLVLSLSVQAASPTRSASEVGQPVADAAFPGAIPTPGESETALEVAARVDELIDAGLRDAHVTVAPRTNDEDFLRRVGLDLAGAAASPTVIQEFIANPDPRKREKLVESLLASDDYARNWARYWRDVVFMRATDMRAQLGQKAFESWMAERLRANTPWDEVAAAMLTATGDVRENGATGLIFAQSGDANEIAAETSRIFLGIQLQCANCHDHPTDHWKRTEFHELAAFFPRIQVIPKRIAANGRQMLQTFEVVSLGAQGGGRFGPGGGPGFDPERFLKNNDSNGDGLLSQDEAEKGGVRLYAFLIRSGGDTNADGKLSLDELKKVRLPPQVGNGFMPDPERLLKNSDTDGDGLISKEEADKSGMRAFTLLMQIGADANGDGKLSVDEIRNARPPNLPGRGALEHFMSDPAAPQSQGQKIDPVFFVNRQHPGAGRSDLERRQSLARYLSDPANPWFAKAFVNRIWGALLGEGFYMPIDDIGPDRKAAHPAALDTLCAGFVASRYDVKWLFRAITNTVAYQRQISAANSETPAAPFGAATPVRLRSDQIYTALVRVLGVEASDGLSFRRDTTMPGGGRGLFDNTPRGQFNRLFRVDPSTVPEDVTGTIPQALYLMNSPLVRNLINAQGKSPLATIINEHASDDDAISQLYLLVHTRRPVPAETQVCRDFIHQQPDRGKAYEDILWSLVNTTEYQTRR